MILCEEKTIINLPSLVLCGSQQTIIPKQSRQNLVGESGCYAKTRIPLRIIPGSLLEDGKRVTRFNKTTHTAETAVQHITMHFLKMVLFRQSNIIIVCTNQLPI